MGRNYEYTNGDTLLKDQSRLYSCIIVRFTMGELTNMKLMTRIVRAPRVILIALSKCKFILLLHGPLDVQYNNSECRPAKFSCEFRLFSFIIKLSYCKKSQAFKLLYLKNNLYRRKIIKKLHIRHYYGYPGFQAVFELLLLQD